MENNRTTNTLSKEGLQLAAGQFQIVEQNQDQSFQYYHRPFMDRPGTFIAAQGTRLVIQILAFTNPLYNFCSFEVNIICSTVG